MSKPSFSTKQLVAVALTLGLWAGWNGPKDWVGPLDRNHTQVLNAVQPARLNARPFIRHNLVNTTHKQVPQVSETYGKLPLSFEANQGQADEEVKFLSRGKGYNLSLTPTKAVLQFPVAPGPLPNDVRRVSSDSESMLIFDIFPFNIRHSHLSFRSSILDSRSSANSSRKSSWLQMQLIGANPNSQVEGLQELPGRTNYFIGNDPRKWRSNIPTYSKVKYKGVYPGIDLVYYGNQGKLEYDWIVAPGSDLKRIHFAFKGAKQIQLDQSGDLVIETASGEVHQHKPVVYQEVEGARHNLAGEYVLKTGDQVGFQVADYDATKPLVIDPVLVYSTFLGGSQSDIGNSIAVDSSGSAYVVGSTNSLDFPTNSPLQPALSGTLNDVFVAKLNPQGTALVYSTYLGGDGNDYGFAVAVDGSGNAYLTGYTLSDNFPSTAGALQAHRSAGADAFVTKLNPNGLALVYSTYLGGQATEMSTAIAVDATGNAFVTGSISSEGLSTPNVVQPRIRGDMDCFVAKLNPSGSTLVYFTYLGGSQEEGGASVAIDSGGNAYVTGTTFSLDFPTVRAIQASFGGGRDDAFVAKINATGSSIVYSTYLGGSSFDLGNHIAVDSTGNAYVVGFTDSTNFPTANPIQASLGGRRDVFLAKLNPTGSAFVYSTYLGGDNDDQGYGVVADPSGNTYLTGGTASINFPLADPLQSHLGGNGDAFVAKVNPTGSGLIYWTFLGGSKGDYGLGIALDDSGNAYVTGGTFSPNYPTTPWAPQPFFGGTINRYHDSGSDAFISKISESATLPDSITLFVPIVLSAGGMNNSFFTSELTLTNRGAKDASVEFDYSAAFGGGSGHGVDSLAAGQQRIVPDAIAYLKSIGVPIPDSGGRGGTLLVHFSGLSAYSDAAVTVRTTTAVSNGRAGLAYTGIQPWSALTGTSYLCGLRQNATDRSNVAIQNAGTPAEGDVVLKLTVFSGDPAAPFSKELPVETLSPGGFRQFSGILQSNGLLLTSGYVRVERVRGNAPYFAYAVINDQVNSDGSFVPPLRESELAGQDSLAIPVVVETSSFSSELVLTNFSSAPKVLAFEFVCDAIQTADATASFNLTLNAGEQLIIPNFIQYLRDQGVAEIGPMGPTFAGPLYVRLEGGARGLFLGARTSAPGGGGRYGLFYVAGPTSSKTITSAWLYGLQQNGESRSNLALVNTGVVFDDQPNAFDIELFDGSTGRKVNTVEGVTLNAKRWLQIGAILSQYAPDVAQGYAHVIRKSGRNPFIAYAVINDGGQPGDRTGDGAFVSSAP